MLLVIDGYNLLNVSDVFPSRSEPPTLERVRTALLDFLVQAIAPKLLARTVIVFDAAGAPPGLPRKVEHRGLAVEFARRGATADELLEELIATAADPRHLLVVSSDHRVQRAARQRGAQYSDSERWYAGLKRQTASATGEEEARQPIENPFPPGYADDLFG
jgi:predicted RNA-binding protein with PIN domain